MKSKTVAAHIQEIPSPKVRRLAKKIRTIVRSSIPEAEESLKMGMPCYSVGKKMVVLIGDYQNHVNLYFVQGARLSSELLKGSGKGMRHIRVEDESSILPEEFLRLLTKAIRNAQDEV
jgi:hypothetical protein